METPILVALIGAGAPIITAIVTFALTRSFDNKKTTEAVSVITDDLEGTANEYEAQIKTLREEIAKLRSDLGKSPVAPIDEEEDEPGEDGDDGPTVIAEKDAFGSRIGTKVSKVNQVITDTPKSMKEIMREAGVSDTMYNHLKDLVYDGYVEKTEDGKYRLKPSPLSALDAAAKLLSETGEAMTCKEMIAAMAEKGYWKSPGGKTPENTLSASIGKEINKKGQSSRFKRTEPGRFAFNNSPATQPAPSPRNPYEEGSISHKLFQIIAANPKLTGGGIIAKTGDTAQYTGKYYNALGEMVKKGHIVKGPSNEYTLANASPDTA